MNPDNKFYKALTIIGIIGLFIIIDYWCLRLSTFASKKFTKIENISIENKLFENKTELFENNVENTTFNKKKIELINLLEENSNSTKENENVVNKSLDSDTEDMIKDNSQKEKNRLNIINEDVEKENSKDNKKHIPEIIIISPTNEIHFPYANLTNKEELIQEINKTLSQGIKISNDTNILLENNSISNNHEKADIIEGIIFLI